MVFVLAGVHGMHIAVGHSVFLPAFYLPWIVYFLLEAVRTGAIRPALYAGAGLALMIYNGSVHLAWMAVPAIACLAAALAAAAGVARLKARALSNGARRLRADGASASLAEARASFERAEAGGFSRAYPAWRPILLAVVAMAAGAAYAGPKLVPVVSFVASDGRGGECAGSVRICVPHDQRHGHACVDSGAVIDSTGPCASR